MRAKTLLMNLVIVLSVAAVGCGGGRMAYNLPPAQQLMHPGPGVGGPGPGVIPVGNQMTGPAAPASYGPGGTPAYATSQCQYCEDGGCQGGACMAGPVTTGTTSQVAFVGEDGLQVSWDVSGSGTFDSSPLYLPGRQDFPQGAIYRLKLQNIPGRAGVMLYPTLEIAPVTPRTDAYLAHAPVPVQFTEEDFDQVVSGNYVTKVIYLPDPEFQELALSGVETLVSTRLDPGVDPVSEADRRGSILAILRMGSKDLESGGGYNNGNVVPASCDTCGPNGSGFSGGYAAESYGGGYEGSYGGGGLPVGAPAAGFAPNAMPPHMIAGMGPQYGMPHVGTPIGLPGPPHIPLGSPAGLRKHVMRNRTRVNLPPPTNQVTISVKQRPGMNYPRPVNKVRIDEVHRAPFQAFGGTIQNPVVGAAKGVGARVRGAAQNLGGGDACQECY